MIDRPSLEPYTPSEIQNNRARISNILQNLVQKKLQIESEPFNPSNNLFKDEVYQGIYVEASKVGYPEVSEQSVFILLKRISYKTIDSLSKKIQAISELLATNPEFKDVLNNLEGHYFDASTPNILPKSFKAEMLPEEVTMLARLSEDLDIQLQLVLGYFTNNFIKIDTLNENSDLNLSQQDWQEFFTMLVFNMQDDNEINAQVSLYLGFLQRHSINNSEKFITAVSASLTEIADLNKDASDAYAKDLYLNVCRNSLQFRLQMLTMFS